MQIVYLNDKEKLNRFIAGEKYSQFLQSWEWGEFNQELGSKIIRLGIEENNQIIAVASLIKKTLPLGKSYFYCPRGPVIILDLGFEIYNLFFKEITKIAKKEKAIFLRFEPLSKINLKSEIKYHKSLDVQPSRTMILDLNKSEEEILNSMHQKTRYNIRLAEKKGIIITEANTTDFEEFWKIMQETKTRDQFGLHPKKYYQDMLKIDFLKLLIAKTEDRIIAGGIFSFFGDTATYIHGASSNQDRNLMAPYLLQWEAIKQAKINNRKFYDFFGINEVKWPGVTRFKQGFGGSEIEYPGTYDFILNQMWYNIYKLIRKARRSM